MKSRTELEKEGNALNNTAQTYLIFGYVFVFFALGFGVLAALAHAMYIAGLLMCLIAGIACFGWFNRFDNDSYAICIKLEHIHYAWCDDADAVEVVETIARYQYGSSGPWGMDSGHTVVDSHVSQCTKCKSRTKHSRGTSPMMLVKW